jgi:hypothetical protein
VTDRHILIDYRDRDWPPVRVGVPSWPKNRKGSHNGSCHRQRHRHYAQSLPVRLWDRAGDGECSVANAEARKAD